MQDVILHGDCLELLKTLESNSVDSLVCDPPAGIAFMGKDWDKDKGGKQEWIAWLSEVMREALRCIKPGGHALVWALPRTSHWTATALEDAGWEIRDCLVHVFGSGFPKSHDISKAIDKMAGAEREVVGRYTRPDGSAQRKAIQGWRKEYVSGEGGTLDGEGIVTAPATPDAQRWSGYGSALKPASEHWILARKPLAAANLASNVLQWGTGGLNIDASRVGSDAVVTRAKAKGNSFTHVGSGQGFNGCPESWHAGRWPPNFLLSHAACCTPLACHESCPVAAIDEQAGERSSHDTTPGGQFLEEINSKGFTRGSQTKRPIGRGDTGGVSRFFPVFYAAKASRRERNAGCEALPVKVGAKQFNEGMEGKIRSDGTVIKESIQQANSHPTVKSLALMSWLVRLITPPNGTVLDCFAGSGSTLVACVQEGFHFIGMEQSEEYCQIARARVAHAQREQRPAKPRAKITRLPKRPKEVEQLAMFA